MRYLNLLLVLLFLVFTSTVSASFWGWNSMSSSHFHIYYPDDYQDFAIQSLYYLETNLSGTQDLIGKSPSTKKTTVVIQYPGLYSNGYASSLTSKITLYPYQPDSRTSHSLGFNQNWLQMLNIHELTHREQLDHVTGNASLSVTLWGNIASPQLFLPGTLIEGLAVFQESQFTPYSGRLNEGTFDAHIYTKAQASELPSLLESMYFHNYFPFGQWYLYGGVFTQYLFDTYGAEKVRQFFTFTGSNSNNPFGIIFPQYGIDAAANHAFGHTLPDLYSDWANSISTANLSTWKSAQNPLVTAHNGSFSNIVAVQNKLYYIKTELVFIGPYTIDPRYDLVEYDTSIAEERVLLSFNSAPNGPIQYHNGSLYYLLKEIRPGYSSFDTAGQGFTSQLFRFQIDEEKNAFLYEAPIHAFSVMDDGSIYYTTPINGHYGNTLWRYYQNSATLLGSFDQDIREMIPYKDDLIVVSKPQLGSWNINTLTLSTLTLTPLVNTRWTEHYLFRDGESLLFSANYEKRHGLYTMDLTTNTVSQYKTASFAQQGVHEHELNQLYYSSISLSGMSLFSTPATSNTVTLPDPEPITTFTIPDSFLSQLKPTSTLKENVKSLFPHTRLIPFLFLGEDDLNAHSYSFWFSSSRSSFSLQSRLFSPLTIAYSHTVDADKDTTSSTTLQYPLYRSLIQPISYVNFSYTSSNNDQYPGLQLGYPDGYLNTYFDSTGDYLLQLSHRHLLDRSHIHFQSQYASDFDIVESRRGFESHIKDEASGYTYSVDYIHPLLSYRSGLWSPQLFIGDIYGSLFIDGIETDKSQICYGYELQFETGILFRLPLATHLGIAFSEGESSLYFNISLD